MLHRKPIVPAFLSEEDVSGFVQLHADQPSCFASQEKDSNRSEEMLVITREQKPWKKT